MGPYRLTRPRRNLTFTLFIGLFAFFVSPAVLAQPPASQTIGGVTRQQENIDQSQSIKDRLTGPKAPEGDVVSSQEELTSGPEASRVLIKTIVVENATLLADEEIRDVVGPYEGRELTLEQMQKIADLLTDRYRRKGFVTSRAYIPQQTIENNTLVIRVIEGKTGQVDIRGNRHFRSENLRRHLNWEKDGYFDYSALQQSLGYINEHPDRTARAVLMPGKKPGTTDVVIEVEDRLPFHVGLQYDNYGSRYIGSQRYTVDLEHNNLFGFDDRFLARFRYSDGALLEMQQAQYVFPIDPTFNVGGYFLLSDLELGEEFRSLGAKGKARVYGLFANKAVVQEGDLDVRLNFGFDYKSIRNQLNGTQTSRDELRVFRLGVDVDSRDTWGRTIFTTEADVGVPDLMGASLSKDPNASRPGAGSKFVKWLFNLYRLQPMPLESTLLWKNTAQYTSYSLVASEQFQIGGPTSVRGYPPAEFSGDKGYYTSVEWSFPLYFLSRTARVPKTKETWYDTLRLVTFYDWAMTHLKKISTGEQENQTLKGAGFGLHFRLRDRISFKIELGYPIGRDPSDDDMVHPWTELTWRF